MKILAFAPFCGVYQHSVPESVLLKQLSVENHVLYLTCNRSYQGGCVVMNANGVHVRSEYDKKIRTCDLCERTQVSVLRKNNFQPMYTEEYIEKHELAQIDVLLNGLTAKNFKDFCFNGMPIGRYAYYLVALTYKKGSFNVTPDEFLELKNSVYDCLKTYFIANRVLKKHKPDAVLIYNSFYPINRVFLEVTRQLAISPFYIHAGPNIRHRLSSLVLGRDHHYKIIQEQFKFWDVISKRTAPKAAFSLIYDHYCELLKAVNPFVYSSSPYESTNNVEYFSNINGRKVVLLTMSSFDERFSAEMIDILEKQKGLLFESQIQWVKETIELFKNKTDCYLIIRVHPREFPNKRDGVLSDHAKSLKEYLVDLPENIVVNWPEDNISLYALMEITDLCLNFSSTVGKELVFFGIPVITYATNGLGYPTDLNYLVNSFNEYKRHIHYLLSQKTTLEKLVLLFRWYAIEFYYSVLYLNKAFVSSSESPPNFSQRVYHKVMRTLDPVYIAKRHLKENYQWEPTRFITDFFQSTHDSILPLRFERERNFSEDQEIALIIKVWRDVYSKCTFFKTTPKRARELIALFDEYEKSEVNSA